MLYWVRYCLLLPWKLPLSRHAKRVKIFQLLVVTVIVVALVTTFVTGLLFKSCQDGRVHFRVCSSPALLDSNSSRLESVPTSDREQPTSTHTSAQPTLTNDCKLWKRTSQHRTTLITKTACVRNYTLLILVSSAPANLARRNLIRQTWGPVDNTSVPQWKTYFLLGQTRNETLSGLLKTEENNYGDMIRADYYEHYWNQTLKIQMAFEWAARYCNFSFLLKADDDVLVNNKQLIDVLQSESTPKKRLYMGKLHSHPKVYRDGKFSVTYEEYNHTHYPDFCSGAGFVMSYDVVECLVPLFEVIKPYRLDDVYVGMLANNSGTIAVGHSGFVMPFAPDYWKCNFVPNTLVQHRTIGKCLMKLFKMHQIWNS